MAGFALVGARRGGGAERVQRVFEAQGLSSLTWRQYPAASVIIASSPTAGIKNWYVEDEESEGAVSGTLVYGSRDSHESLRALLADWKRGAISYNEITGSYAALLRQGARIEILLDAEGIHPLFALEDGSAVSTSHLAVLAAATSQPDLSMDGLMEALLTGAITPPDTLFRGVCYLTGAPPSGWLDPLVTVRRARPDVGAVHKVRSLEEAVEAQLGELRAYFRRVRHVIQGRQAHIGLSSGYDSRLLLLLAKEAGYRLCAFTFSSEVHKAERGIAEMVAAEVGVPLRQVSVRRWETLRGEDLESNIKDAIYYFDGRTNQTMGSFNDVHTRAARLRALDAGGVGLTGLCGELLRNRDHLRPGRLAAERWFEYFVLSPQSVAAFRTKRVGDAFTARILAKYGVLSGRSSWDNFSRRDVRQIFERVWNPYFAGVRLAAESLVTESLMPFSDRRVTRTALGCTRWIGMGGGLEAAMIRSVDARVAGVISGYGHSFERVPTRVRMQDAAVGMIPLSVRSLYGALHVRRPGEGRAGREHPALEVAEVKRGLEEIRAMGMPIGLDALLAPGAYRDRTLFLAATIGRRHLLGREV
jgi:asparagine synthetase B (glutamine-hydrolysing)